MYDVKHPLLIARVCKVIIQESTWFLLIRQQKRNSLDEEIEDDRSARKMDRGRLGKWKNPPLDALEHRMRRKERRVGEVHKKRIKLT
jgi:hypothetical protein